MATAMKATTPTATPARSERLSNAQGRDPIVLAVSGASAQPLAQRALQLLLQADERVELVVSRGAIGVWQAELGVRVPSDPDAQEQFWRERIGCSSGSLRCHRWNDQATGIASGSYRTCRARWARWGASPLV